MRVLRPETRTSPDRNPASSACVYLRIVGHVAYQRGEKLWLVGREVTFLSYRQFEHPQPVAPRVGAAVVRGVGEAETREVPLWLLARDRDESVSRANAIPLPLREWDID